MFGMLKFQVPEGEVLYLVKFFYDITYLSLIFEMWACWLEPITSAMLCYGTIICSYVCDAVHCG